MWSPFQFLLTTLHWFPVAHTQTALWSSGVSPWPVLQSLQPCVFTLHCHLPQLPTQWAAQTVSFLSACFHVFLLLDKWLYILAELKVITPAHPRWWHYTNPPLGKPCHYSVDFLFVLVSQDVSWELVLRRRSSGLYTASCFHSSSRTGHS